MPDISGFTKFVASNEIEYAQSIIQELLEVRQIEDDAVFFYRLGGPPPFALLQQVQTFFTRFHHHPQIYAATHRALARQSLQPMHGSDRLK